MKRLRPSQARKTEPVGPVDHPMRVGLKGAGVSANPDDVSTATQ
ncbi:hypothetical protein [Haloplanus natans]|nr:hypothetical protein [Haloplanus natans]